MIRRFMPSILLGLLVSAGSSSASFHFMQIERVTGGVAGDTGAQAIQLRMRSNFQGQTQLSRLIAYDAAGANPVILVDIMASVPNANTGNRVLIATAGFSSRTDPAAVPDFVMTNPIPESYLAAGCITFSHDPGTVYWRFSWGGDAYTGATTGSTVNDANGNFGPPVAGALATDGGAWVFQGAATAFSTTNLADYAMEALAPFTNNAGNSFTPQAITGLPGDSYVPRILGATPNPFGSSGTTLSFDLPADGPVSLLVMGIDGTVVRRAFEGDLRAGTHSLPWNGKDDLGRLAPAGVFFLRVMTRRGASAFKVVRSR